MILRRRAAGANPPEPKWDSNDIHEQFGYRYTDEELTDWATKIRALARDAEVTHVLFNNCFLDYSQVTPSNSPP